MVTVGKTEEGGGDWKIGQKQEVIESEGTVNGEEYIKRGERNGGADLKWIADLEKEETQRGYLCVTKESEREEKEIERGRRGQQKEKTAREVGETLAREAVEKKIDLLLGLRLAKRG